MLNKEKLQRLLQNNIVTTVFFAHDDAITRTGYTKLARFVVFFYNFTVSVTLSYTFLFIDVRLNKEPNGWGFFVVLVFNIFFPMLSDMIANTPWFKQTISKHLKPPSSVLKQEIGPFVNTMSAKIAKPAPPASSVELVGPYSRANAPLRHERISNSNSVKVSSGDSSRLQRTLSENVSERRVYDVRDKSSAGRFSLFYGYFLMLFLVLVSFGSVVGLYFMTTYDGGDAGEPVFVLIGLYFYGQLIANAFNNEIFSRYTITIDYQVAINDGSAMVKYVNPEESVSYEGAEASSNIPPENAYESTNQLILDIIRGRYSWLEFKETILQGWRNVLEGSGNKDPNLMNDAREKEAVKYEKVYVL